MGHERPTPERASPEPTHAEFVGWFGLVPSATRDAEFEVGYRLRRDAWGKGLATEGTRALIDVALEYELSRAEWERLEHRARWYRGPSSGSARACTDP
jgi:RimJ/RimL family protein N-acetyltransferase